MKISVILCTYNRARSLAKALESVASSIVPDSIDWEVLVIDNNSNDRTRQVAEEYCHRFPLRFRYIFEPRQGKSIALNTGIHASNGEILAFMDDDVEVDRAWLYNLTNPLMNGTWSGVGGRILPESGFTPPNWIETNSRYALAPLAVFDLGTEAGELNEAPFGTNMAFLGEMFSKYGGFRAEFGPQPGKGIQHNEDSEFGSRLLAHGERFWYEPSAVVYHSVTDTRVQPGYFLAWWFDKARSDIRQDGIPKDLKWCIGGVPVTAIRRLFSWGLCWAIAANPARRFSCKLNVWKLAGMIKECRSLRAGAKRLSVQDAGKSAPNSLE